MRGGRAAIMSDAHLHCWNSGCRLEVGREKQPRERWEMQIQLVPSLAYIRVQLESLKEFSSIQCFKIIIIKDIVGEGRWPLGDVNATFWLLFLYSDIFFSLNCEMDFLCHVMHSIGMHQVAYRPWEPLGRSLFDSRNGSIQFAYLVGRFFQPFSFILIWQTAAMNYLFFPQSFSE